MSRKPMNAIISEALLEASTDAEKVAVLKKYDSDSLFKRIVQYAHNPLIQFGIDNIPEQPMGREHGMGISKFMHLPDDISSNSLTAKEGLFAINMVLSHINEEEVSLFVGMFKKDLGLGLTVDIINEAWPNFIPPYPVMQPTPYDPSVFENWYHFTLMEIHEGDRINIICRKGEVEFRDDTGKILTQFDEHKSVFSTLGKDGRIVFDAVWDGKQFILYDSIRYDGFVEGKDNRLGFNWRFNGIQQLWYMSKMDRENSIFKMPMFTAVPDLAQMKEEVTKLGKPCYLRSPSGIWKDGPSNEWQIVTPEDVA